MIKVSKYINLLKYRNGDYIVSRIKSNPLLTHSGLVVIEKGEVFVYHNTPVEINAIGGNVVKQSIKEYEETRDVISIQRTSLTKEQIEQASNDLAHKKFDIVMFNCEHFVYFIKKGKFISPQMAKWTLIGVGALMLIYFMQKNKPSN